MAQEGVRAWFGPLLELLAPWRCPACDFALPGPVSPAGLCPACAPLIEPVRRGLGAYAYGGPLATAIQRFKFQGRSELGGPLGALLAEAAIERHGGQVDAVVPVPLHPRRLRERGYDQVGLLARPVASALGVPLRRDLLARRRPTKPQAGLGAAQRLLNVRGAFALEHCPRAPFPRRILLLDDVTTTGATLHAAASPLREAGVERVLRLALAQRLPDAPNPTGTNACSCAEAPSPPTRPP